MAVTRFESIVSAQSVGTQDVDKLAASFEKLAGSIENSGNKADKVSKHPGFDGFAEKVKTGIEDPLHAAADAMDSVLKAAGPMGTGVAAGIGIFTAAGVAGFEAAKGLGEYANTLERTGIRMGLSGHEAGEFSFAMRRSGGDVESLEAIMRKLSAALVDTSADGAKGRAALSDLGVKAYDDAGKLKPMADIIVQIGDGLAGMESVAKRNDAAVKIMGRGALTTLPDLLKLSDGLRRARETGLSPSDQDLERWTGYHQQIAEAEARWDALARKVKEPIAGVFTVLMRGASGDVSDIAEEATKSLQGQIGKISKPDAMKRLDQLEGWITEAAFRELKKQIDTADLRAHPFDTSGLPKLGDIASSLRGPIERALQTGTGDDKGKLHDAEEHLKSLQGQLEARKQLGAPLPGQLDLADEIEKQRGIVTALEARIKKTEDLKAAEKELQAFELSMREEAQDPIDKLFLKRDELVKKGANADRASMAAIQGATALVAKEYAKQEEENEKIQLKLEDYVNKSWLKIYEENDAANERFVASFLKASQKVEEIDLKGKVTRLQGDSQQRMNFLGLASGPGQEVALVNAQYAERLDLAQKIYAIENAQALRETDKDKQRTALAEAYGTLLTSQYDAELEQELRIGELQRKRLDDLRNLSGQFFDALTQGRPGIEQFFANLGKGWARTMFENFATEELKGLSGHLSLPGQGTSANPTLLGKVLAGTPFGLDPLKDQASVKLSTAGLELSGAASELMAAARSLAVSGSSGGGGLVRGGVGIFTKAAGAVGAEGVPEGRWEPSGVNGDFGGETSHPAGSFNWNEALGIGGAAAGGAVGIYAGLKSSGPRSALTVAGSAVAMTGAILSMASKALKIAGPIGEVAGIALGLATMFLPDAKAARDKQESERLASARYTAPTSTNYTRDRYGRDYDTDVSGAVRPLIGEVHITALDPQAAADAVLESVAIGLEAKRSTRAAMALRNTVRSS